MKRFTLKPLRTIAGSVSHGIATGANATWAATSWTVQPSHSDGLAH